VADMLDLLIREAKVVTATAVREANIGISGGTIEFVGAEAEKAQETVDASGFHVFPGLIDAHVHFNEPGRTEWEGIETGSRALAAGGGTMFFDMPLNAHPPTLDRASFDLKRSAAEAKSLTDFALWGGLVPGNLDQLEALAERGVIGFKAFLSNSGVDDFARADNSTLREGMKVAARLKRIVAVHAESEAITSELSQKLQAAGKTSARDYLDSRPIEAELEAIHVAVEMAAETKCALHIVHVSCGAGIALVASASRQGVSVSCETCPHYLTLTEEDVIRIGAQAKCAPPLRPKSAQDVLWEYLKAGEIMTVGSDHSPSPPDMKKDSNFFRVWGGVAGAQHTLPLLITEGHVNRAMALPLISRVTCFNVAERFGLPPNKRGIQAGGDADLVLIDLNAEKKVRVEDLHQRHKNNPYVGRSLTGRVVRTILRGRTIYKDGEIVSTPIGRLVTPRA